MTHRTFPAFFGLFILVFLAAPQARSEDKIPVCNAMDRPCLMKQIEVMVPTIEKQDWKDQSLRELAKTYSYEGQTDKAIALISQIVDNDTKAMTIRGIGMAAASLKWPLSQYKNLFTKLAEQAQMINHPPSQGIAYTYIAMSQAFAGDDEGARKTASSMSNGALRNKAYGETAEIEAERGDIANVLITLAAIDTPSYRNKAYDTVSRIFLDKAYVEHAYACAEKIDNPFLRIKSIQRILNKGNSEEQDMEPSADLTKEFKPTEIRKNKGIE